MLKTLLALEDETSPVESRGTRLSAAELGAECEARAGLYRLLSGVFVEEPGPALVQAMRRPETLQSLADRMGVCKERVRQLEKRAMMKLRRMAGEASLEDPGE